MLTALLPLTQFLRFDFGLISTIGIWFEFVNLSVIFTSL